MNRSAGSRRSLAKRAAFGGLVGLWSLATAPAFGAGHGPAFALATPTLGEGTWSSDTSVMNLTTDEGKAYMIREMLAYGITEDLTASLSVPLAPGADGLKLDNPPRTRGQAMMGGFGEVDSQFCRNWL